MWTSYWMILSLRSKGAWGGSSPVMISCADTEVPETVPLIITVFPTWMPLSDAVTGPVDVANFLTEADDASTVNVDVVEA